MEKRSQLKIHVFKWTGSIFHRNFETFPLIWWGSHGQLCVLKVESVPSKVSICWCDSWKIIPERISRV